MCPRRRISRRRRRHRLHHRRRHRSYGRLRRRVTVSPLARLSNPRGSCRTHRQAWPLALRSAFKSAGPLRTGRAGRTCPTTPAPPCPRPRGRPANAPAITNEPPRYAAPDIRRLRRASTPRTLRRPSTYRPLRPRQHNTSEPNKGHINMGPLARRALSHVREGPSMELIINPHNSCRYGCEP